MESSCPSATCLTVSQEEVYGNAPSDVACVEHVPDAMGAALWMCMFSAVTLQETTGDVKVLFPSSLSHQASCLHILPACLPSLKDRLDQAGKWLDYQSGGLDSHLRVSDAPKLLAVMQLVS